MNTKFFQVMAIILAFQYAVSFWPKQTAAQDTLFSELSLIEKNLSSYRGQLGKHQAQEAIDLALTDFGPLLVANKKQILHSAPLIKKSLQIAALFCSIDPSYLSIEFVLDLENSKLFDHGLKTLPIDDQKCIRQATRILRLG